MIFNWTISTPWYPHLIHIFENPAWGLFTIVLYDLITWMHIFRKPFPFLSFSLSKRVVMESIEGFFFFSFAFHLLFLFSVCKALSKSKLESVIYCEIEVKREGENLVCYTMLILWILKYMFGCKLNYLSVWMLVYGSCSLDKF